MPSRPSRVRTPTSAPPASSMLTSGSGLGRDLEELTRKGVRSRPQAQRQLPKRRSTRFQNHHLHCNCIIRVNFRTNSRLTTLPTPYPSPAGLRLWLPPTQPVHAHPQRYKGSLTTDTNAYTDVRPSTFQPFHSYEPQTLRFTTASACSDPGPMHSVA
ncbi:unnamed protein product [Cyclocybe aegerita]|uniref:Uncharacterized protein n=1 Tax=Cyclocybe aegerita TaxID=1973307 RepID=A0A8S0W5J1_CYCAE|nr:unnamed protein product [Cyclocybe aegerita]